MSLPSTKRVLLLSIAVIAAGVALSGIAPPLRAAGVPVRGTVVDELTGEPVAGVDVRVQASLTDVTETAADGSFDLVVSREPGEVVIVAATKA
ncbi:MAG: hypothetical protein IT175_15235, partial [Acidobacteria bacterium]|nr:hypothetical protein [Acidobacteriota bacterium]